MNKHYLIFINLFAVCSIIADECASEDDVNRKPTSVAYHLSQTASNAVASNIAGISNGGTGKDTFTAYAVLAGGITSQSPLQQISGVGTAGQVLTSAGAGALPTWQDGAGGGGIQTITGNTGGALTGSNINFTGGTTG